MAHWQGQAGSGSVLPVSKVCKEGLIQRRRTTWECESAMPKAQPPFFAMTCCLIALKYRGENFLKKRASRATLRDFLTLVMNFFVMQDIFQDLGERIRKIRESKMGLEGRLEALMNNYQDWFQGLSRYSERVHACRALVRGEGYLVKCSKIEKKVWAFRL